MRVNPNCWYGGKGTGQAIKLTAKETAEVAAKVAAEKAAKEAAERVAREAAERVAKEAARLARIAQLIKAGKYLDEAAEAATLIGKTQVSTIIEDTAKIAVKDVALSGGANVVKGTGATASDLVGNMADLVRDTDKIASDGSKIMIWLSKDTKWKIQLRTFSSSAQQIADAGYKLEMTMDVMQKVGSDTITKEIKFITKALQ